jgi:drug/metabolite transporter (DMT)-like permease
LSYGERRPVAFTIPARRLNVAAQPQARGALAAAIFLGVVPAALGYLAWSFVLHRFTLSQAASTLYLIPLVTVLMSYLWIHERSSWATLLGGIIAILGVVLLNLYGKPRTIQSPQTIQVSS